MSETNTTNGAEELVRGYALFDFTQQPTQETLFALFDDGRVAAAGPRPVLPVFGDPNAAWRFVPAIPDRAEYIGLYAAPTVSA